MTFRKAVWIYILLVFFCVACKDKDAFGEDKPEKISVQFGPTDEPNSLNYISCMELSEEGKILVVGTGISTKAKPAGWPGIVAIFDVPSHKILKVIKIHNYPIDAIAISSNGKVIASCDNQGKIFLTDLEKYKSIPIYTSSQQQQRYCMKFSSDDTLLYVTDEHSIIGIDVQNFNVAKEYKTNTPVYSFAFYRNGTELIAGYGFAGGDQKLIRIWNVSQKQIIHEYVAASQIDEEAIYGVYVLPDDNNCVIRGAMSLYTINLLSGEYEQIWSTSNEQVSGGELTDLDLSNDGECVAVSSYYVNGILDLKTKKLVSQIDSRLNTNTLCKIRFDKSGNLFVGRDSNIYLWKPESNKYELWHDLNTMEHQ